MLLFILLSLLPLIAEIITEGSATKIVPRNHCIPKTSKIEMYQERPIINKQLILPPSTVQLPRGLGYFSAAVSDVKTAYLESLSYSKLIPEINDMVIPKTNMESSISLACPLCPYLGSLINPIIL